MFLENKTNDVELDFQRKLERKIKDKDLVEHLISFYDKQIEELVVSIFLFHLDGEACLSDEYLTRYSFLLKNEHYLEANHKNRFVKTRDIAKFEMFDVYFEKHFDEIKTDFKDCEAFDKILKDKDDILNEFQKTKNINEIKEHFLKLRKNNFSSRFMDLSTVLFLGVCFSLLYQLGINKTTIGIAFALSITFTFIQSSGYIFETNRFKYKVNKIFPKTFMKSLNFVSSLYMSCYVFATLIMLLGTSLFIANYSSLVFGFEVDYVSEALTFFISSISGYWQFRRAIYEKRYFMTKLLEKKKSKDEMLHFFENINNK